jgi:hypothetical protein
MNSGNDLVSNHKSVGKKPYNSRIFGAGFVVTGHKEPKTSGDAGEEKNMRRFAVVVSAIAALMLVWAGAALAQDEDANGCNGTIFLSDSTGADQGTDPQYTEGETVYVFGSGFDTNDTSFTFTVTLLPSTPVASGTLTGDGAGNISNQAVFDTSDATDDGPYKVEVFWGPSEDDNPPNGCKKSKNFKINLEEEGGGAGGQPPAPPQPPSSGGAAGALGGEAGAGQGELPFTGVPFALLGIAGLALMLGGLGLMRSGRNK